MARGAVAVAAVQWTAVAVAAVDLTLALVVAVAWSRPQITLPLFGAVAALVFYASLAERRRATVARGHAHIAVYAWLYVRATVTFQEETGDYDYCNAPVRLAVQIALGACALASVALCTLMRLPARRHCSGLLPYLRRVPPMLGAAGVAAVAAAVPHGYCVSFVQSTGPFATVVQTSLFLATHLLLLH